MSTSERLAAIVEPIRQELEKVDAELETKWQEVLQLRDDRRRLAAVLRQATGGGPKPPGPKKTGNRGSRARGSATFVPVVRDWLAAHPNPEGFIAAQIQRDIKAAANGKDSPSPDSVRLAFREMNANGELRILKRVKGGAPLYQVTTPRGSKE